MRAQNGKVRAIDIGKIEFMIKTTISLLLLCFAALVVEAAPPNPPTNLHVPSSASTGSYLTVSGSGLAYKGQTVVLRGENFNNAPGLSCCGGPNINSINANAADYAQARNVLGLNSIRFGLDYQWWNADNSTFYKIMDQHIAWAKTNHLWMIPVMFIPPGDPNGNPFGNQDGFWGNSANMAALTTFWRAFAEHYANEPTIAGYDIYNEPGPPSLAAYNAWCQSTYNAITAVDTNHFVVLENDGGEGRGSFPSVTGSRILWSSHCYSGCTTAAVRPLWIGEYGAQGTPGTDATAIANGLAAYNAAGISWCHFVMHWSSGGYGLYQSWTAGDFSSPWTQMIQAVQNAAKGIIYPQ
jgi:hypothetical protein